MGNNDNNLNLGKFMRRKTSYPIIDMHCDMLYYLHKVENSNPYNKEDIGCAIPYLKDGNVKLQVMAIYSNVEKGSVYEMINQSELLVQLANQNPKDLALISNTAELNQINKSTKIGMLLSIENASSLCEEDESIYEAFSRLDRLLIYFKRILYISLTHHGENRFGGGNNTNIGLKDDGKLLLKYLHGKRIAVDLSHCCDALAYDILNEINKSGLNIPILASHSNFRSVREHVRNLPDELAEEIINRRGLIGINFLRAVVHPEKPEKLVEHIQHGFEIGAGNAICFGADFFYTKSHPEKSRIPFFFNEHEHAGKYPKIIDSLSGFLDDEQITALTHHNAIEFIHRIWGNSFIDDL